MTFLIFKTSLQPPKPRTVTMLTNVAEKYGISFLKVKNAYFRGIFNMLVEKKVKPTKKAYTAALEALEPADYRVIWYKLHNNLQAAVKKEGGEAAKSLAAIQSEAKAIIKNDITKLTRRVDKLEKQLEDKVLKRFEAGEAKVRIAMYREYMRKVKNKESLGHFTQMLRDNPELGSFLFKPKKK